MKNNNKKIIQIAWDRLHESFNVNAIDKREIKNMHRYGASSTSLYTLILSEFWGSILSSFKINNLLKDAILIGEISTF